MIYHEAINKCDFKKRSTELIHFFASEISEVRIFDPKNRVRKKIRRLSGSVSAFSSTSSSGLSN